jgi:putative ATPase
VSLSGRRRNRRSDVGDLFEARREEVKASVAPLAARMRPTRLDEVVGQSHLIGQGAAFKRLVDSGRLMSMILWGPPGTGKTTLARLAAGEAWFEQLSATSAGVRDVRRILEEADRRLGEEERRTVLFLDEIHRFSKSQQDALLPGVEDGTIILIGATTENPFFEVNSPLISRASLFRLERIEPADLETLLERAMRDPRGLGGQGLSLDGSAKTALAERVGGDARLALNGLEVAAGLANGAGRENITEGDIAEALQRRIVRYDKSGDRHYDVISAFIKSMRGSDPDAAAYWLHTMLEAGEDPEFIVRRMLVFASEDVGLADRHALPVAVAASQALAYVGLPEASYALTHAAVYLATAPKSNTVARTMRAAKEAIAGTPGAEVPPHLRDASYQAAKTIGHGTEYRYPHSYEGHFVAQQYLPDEMMGGRIFEPDPQGDEKEIFDRLKSWRARRPSEGER